MTIKELEKTFEECKKYNLPVCISVTLPGRESTELIINTVENLDYKLEYYKDAYDENLNLKKNSEIKIIDAFPIQFYLNEENEKK